jgi:cytosine/adenosine deaminase-related metal-dependent hydrolase
MSSLLVLNADVLVTMDENRREIKSGGMYIKDCVIQAVDETKNLNPKFDQDADEVIDLSGHVITPGLVNTHHHFYQNLTRAVPAAQDATLFGWLKTLYPIWGRMGPEEVRVSTQIALAEMALSGCTLSSDHLYIFPNGARLDDEIFAAQETGVRLHATRGAMSIGESEGGLPPDALVEDEAAILKDRLRLIQAHNDPNPGAMTRVGVAPCSPFSVSRELMRDAALLARDQHVWMHTHLAENDDDIAYSLANFGCRPGEYAESLGWTGEDVWHAHCVKLDEQEINLFAKSSTGVAHCPCSNMRLGSGIAPIRQMRDAGVNVGLGVDGSASNDSGHLLNEARQAMLLQRVALGGDAMSAREALEVATLGGANVLGRPDLGSLSVGNRADFAAYDMTTIDMAGVWDKVAGLVLCGPMRASHTIVEGRFVVRDGHMVTIDLPVVLEQHAKLAQGMMNG